MTKKSPSLLLSFAVVWMNAAQPIAAVAQGNVRGNIGRSVSVNAVLPQISIPSVGGLSNLPGVGVGSLPNVEVNGIPALPNTAAGKVLEAQAAQNGAPASAAPTTQFAKKGSAASQKGSGQSGTPDTYNDDGTPAEQTDGLDGLGNPSRKGGNGGPDDRSEGGEREGGSTLLRLAKTVIKKLSGRVVFDGDRTTGMAPVGVAGILPLPAPQLPQGVVLDDAPVSPDPKQVSGVEVNNVNIPGARTTGGVFDAGPRVLQADPASEADVERALRELVDQDAASYGVSSAELATVHVRRVAGVGNQADTVFAVFRQQRQGVNPDGSPNSIVVHGTSLSFTVKVINGKPVLMSAMAKLYPNMAVDTRQVKSDAELREDAEARLGIPPNSGVQLEFVERKIIYSKGSWHAANLYVIEGLPFMIAVNVATGEAFAWDSRMGVIDAPSAPDAPVTVSAKGDFKGRVETKDARPAGQPQLTEQPLAFLKVTLANGQVVETDENGQIDVAIDAETEATAVLAGRYVKVNDRANRPTQIKVTLKPGQRATVVINQQDNDEFARSQANVYVAVTHVRQWVGKRGINDKRIDQQIPANVNINDECNAYYTPGRPSLNFFKSSKNCSDTSKPGVVMHEWGHYLDDMIGGIMNGGLSEGWGDILSMYIIDSPIIGEGFLKGRTPDYIRHGENDYQYGKWDEVHDQGQAWMGFAWKLRKALIVSLGEAAGAAAAESIVLPTLYAKASDIPAAIAQVMLNAMDKNGVVQHEKEIRAAAKAHGIDLPKSPGLASSVLSFLTSPLRSFTRAGVQLESVPTGTDEQGTLLAAGAPVQGGFVKATVSFSAGRLIAGQIEREIAKYCEFHDLKWSLQSFGGVLSKDYILKVEGPKEKVDFLISELQRISR